MISTLVQQHFQHPQHIGELASAENVLRVDANSPTTGRHVIFTVAVTDDIVTAVRHRVRGCPYTIATFSYVANWCLHRNISELGVLSRHKLITLLELPATKVHCAAMAEDVLKQMQLQWEAV